MEKKSILIVGPAHPYRGGLATYNERLAREFIREGHEVNIWTFTLQYPNILFPGKTQFSDSPAPKDLKIERKLNSINPFNWMKVGREIARLKPDILLIRYWLPFMGPSLGTISKKARKNKHTKTIALLDNIIPHEKRPGDDQFSNYFVKQVDGFVSMSEQVNTDLNRYDKNKPRKLHPHPLFDNFGEAPERGEALKLLNLSADFSYLLFFGFIRDYKGLDLLLEAIDVSFFKENKLKLLVAGEYYASPEKYEQIIKNRGLEEVIELHTDYIPDEKVNAYFSVADLVVQPYKTATQSGVTQIAFHFDKPMIVTNVGGLPEIVPNEVAGLVTTPNAGAIGQAIKRTYSENLLPSFIEGVQKQKEKFSWSGMTKTMLDLYEELD